MPGLPIVFEDARLLALAKPAGRVVIAGRGLPEEPLSEDAARHCGGKAFVVHRIDRESSGLVLFAKDPKTHTELCSLWEERRVKKRYLAAVSGELSGEGEIDKPLREFGSGRMGVDARGKPSVTRWRCLQALRGGTLLGVEPVTGRRHQIRVHLWSLGHPLLGDPYYGKDRPVGGAPRLLLHALALTLPAPFSLELEAPPPEDFVQEVLARGGRQPFSWKG